MRRFVSLYGVPRTVVSNNGPNFVLGESIINEAMETVELNDEVKAYLGLQGIKWTFITPYSPWKGGFYERMIKSVKQALAKANGKKKMTSSELSTVFYEISAFINERPLTKSNQDFQSDLPIRPCDFIKAEMKTTIPLTLDYSEDYRPSRETQAIQTKKDTLEALKASSETTEAVWKCWQRQYLVELREQHKKRMDSKKGTSATPTVDQLVIIDEGDFTPRNYWRLGRIQKVVEARDGVVREVELLVDSGRTLRRSINQIVPLELDMEPDEEPSETPRVEEAKVEEPKETSGHRYNLRSRNPLINRTVMMALMMTTLICMVTGQKIECTPTGLSIVGQFTEFEACVESYCTKFKRINWKYSAQSEIWIPPALKLQDHQATVKISDGKEVQIREVQCPAVPFCETIDCTFCWSNVLNPECHTYWAVLGIGLMLYCIMMFFHCLFHVPVPIGAPISLAGKLIKMATVGIAKALIQGTRGAVNRIFRRRWNNARRISWEELIPLTIIMLILGSSFGQACQEADVISQQQEICNEDGLNCKTVTEEILKLSDSRKEGCIRLMKNGTVIRDVRVELITVQMNCSKEVLTYTQHAEIKVSSTKRCPRMGSCKDEKCNAINRTSMITELHPANNCVGVTGCSESCGGPGCGCFYLSSGCIFYRIYSEPKSNQKFEIFRCAEFTPSVKLKIKSTRLNSYENKERSKQLLLTTGQTMTLEDIQVTADSIETPISTVINEWFIKSDHQVALWTSKESSLQCDEKLRNCFLEENCNCQSGEDQMNCNCVQNDLEKMFQRTTSRLPIQEGHWRIEEDKDKIKGLISGAVSTTITLKIKENWITKVIKTEEQCSVESSPAVGCYACSPGATAEILCKSTKRATIANVECSEESFTVQCTTEGARTTIHLTSEYAKLHRNCSLGCGGKKREYFEITGILKYTGSIWTSIHRLIAGNTTVFNEINLPDINHLMDSYFTFMKSVITIIFATGIIFLLTYSCISSAGRKFLKGLFKATWIIIKLIIYGIIRVPLFLNRLLRGRTLCLCMLITAFCLLPVQCNKDLITGMNQEVQEKLNEMERRMRAMEAALFETGPIICREPPPAFSQEAELKQPAILVEVESEDTIKKSMKAPGIIIEMEEDRRDHESEPKACNKDRRETEPKDQQRKNLLREDHREQDRQEDRHRKDRQEDRRGKDHQEDRRGKNLHHEDQRGKDHQKEPSVKSQVAKRLKIRRILSDKK
ncbi:hypothetical protein B9Z55_028144 [Caenorhabditis nigoni]|uniref:Integrase catalytic domain-containing protein n=1 Tax=Caenorhabditis nigoni TaxID=1611254 RepID=A0A2G5SDC1_9PELO|nr:hypothetical protein B9Z55_028144 [Caenorhabditis nigoni]